MKFFKLIKTKKTNKNFELLRNIEIICFINPELIEDYSNFLKVHLTNKG